jgi:hypothetical protein
MLSMAAVANAQATMTLGDLLDRGGKKLTGAEVKQLMTGATMSGVQGGNFPNTTFKNSFLDNGAVAGDAWNNGKWFTKIRGTWSVNDAGQFCQELLNDSRERIGGCSNYYQLGNSYYLVRGDARSDIGNERKITK